MGTFESIWVAKNTQGCFESESWGANKVTKSGQKTLGQPAGKSELESGEPVRRKPVRGGRGRV